MRFFPALSEMLRSAFAVGAVALAVPAGAYAALQGRDVDANTANGFEAFYDTVLNITWLADANYAKTSGYSPTGLFSWEQATAWATTLNFHGVDGWRLPHFKPLNGVAPIVDDFENYYTGLADIGFNIHSTGYELATMYYDNLGLRPSVSTDGVLDATAGVSPTGQQSIPNIPGSFIANLKANMYWENVVFQLDAQKAWGFWTRYPVAGSHGVDYKARGHYAWAVHDGDPFKLSGPPVPSVAEPASVWMMAAGLGICTLLARKHNYVAKQAKP